MGVVITISNGYSLLESDGSKRYVENETFDVTLASTDPTIGDVLEEVREYLSDRPLFKDYLNKYISLVEPTTRTDLTDLSKRLSDYGLASGVVLRVKSSAR